MSAQTKEYPRVAFFADRNFIVVAAERIVRNDKFTVYAIADTPADAAILEPLRRAYRTKQMVGAAYDLTGLYGRAVGYRDEVTTAGRRVIVEIDEQPLALVDPMPVTMISFPPSEVAKSRARRILLDEVGPIREGGISAEYLNAMTREVFIQNRRAPLPVLRSPLPILWQNTSPERRADFITDARLILVLFLRLSDTVDSIERLDLKMLENSKLGVSFLGLRSGDGDEAIPIEVRGVVDLSVVRPEIG
jgi:hypothetical protein